MERSNPVKSKTNKNSILLRIKKIWMVVKSEPRLNQVSVIYRNLRYSRILGGNGFACRGTNLLLMGSISVNSFSFVRAQIVCTCSIRAALRCFEKSFVKSQTFHIRLVNGMVQFSTFKHQAGECVKRIWSYLADMRFKRSSFYTHSVFVLHVASSHVLRSYYSTQKQEQWKEMKKLTAVIANPFSLYQ